MFIIVCDPVMGDNGKLYVPQELVTIYKEFVVPLATILTPNLFEAELLTDLKINSVEDVWKAIEILHGRGCPTVVISSADLGDGELHVFASHKGTHSIFKLEPVTKKRNFRFGG